MEVNGLCCFIFENSKAAAQEFKSFHATEMCFPVNLKPGVPQILRLKVSNPSFYRPHKNKFAKKLTS